MVALPLSKFTANTSSAYDPRGREGTLNLPPESLAPLHGKLVCISVKDAGMDFHFTIGNKGFVAVTPKHEPDLTIRATAYDFFTLATRTPCDVMRRAPALFRSATDFPTDSTG